MRPDRGAKEPKVDKNKTVYFFFFFCKIEVTDAI